MNLMRTSKPILSFLSLIRHRSNFFVSNVSKKKFRYSFEVGSVRKIHPMRELSQGTDRLLITPNLIAVTDHGAGAINKQFSQNLDGSYPQRLLKIMNAFFYKQIDKYMENPYSLVQSAVNAVKLEGSCSLTFAMSHPETGEVVFYYIGDCLYGIFQERQVVMVEAIYESFNQPIRIGDYPAQSGYVERYPYKEIKDETILVASNGIWDNVGLDGLHYEIRGPNSYQSYEKEENRGKGENISKGQPRSLQDMAERIGTIGVFYSRKGHYESPIYKRAQREKFEYPKEGYLDDIAVMVAKVRRDIEIM